MTQDEVYDDIRRLKREKHAVILAHYYQPAEVQRAADILGDSLQLSQEAGRTDAEVIVFCGVRFMAETASIISPDKKVLLPARNAGCSLASSIRGVDIRHWRESHPDGLVVSYVNTTAEVKAETDYCVTSSNALDIVSRVPKDRPMLFCPDRNLGRYIESKTGRKMEIWEGMCIVHAMLQRDDAVKYMDRYPEADILIHPEAPAASDPELQASPRVLIGSTSAILKRPVQFSEPHTFCVGTESGIMTELERLYPQHTFIPMLEDVPCRMMKMTSLEDLHQALLNDQYEVKVPDELRERAIVPIQRMLDMSR